MVFFFNLFLFFGYLGVASDSGRCITYKRNDVEVYDRSWSLVLIRYSFILNDSDCIVFRLKMEDD